MTLGVKDAVVLRLQNLCRARKITLNEAANRSGLTPSTVYSMADPRRREISITTIKKLCDGLEITLAEFFDAPEFAALEQELR